MYLIVSAMGKEIEYVVQKEKLESVFKSKIFNLYKKQNEDDVYFLVTGIGKVNASLALTNFIVSYNLDPKHTQIIVFGVCGGLPKLTKLMQPYLIERAYYGDVDLTTFGYEVGQIPGEIPYFLANKQLNDMLNNLITTKSLLSANIATFDTFIQDDQHLKVCQTKWNQEVALVDMETTAYFHVAHKLNFDIAAIKVVSDLINVKDYETNIDASTKLIHEIIKEIIYEK